jgi:hypothetical protein
MSRDFSREAIGRQLSAVSLDQTRLILLTADC